MNTVTADLTDLTVGQIAARQPASVRVFERYHIDFCCGGNVPVAEACRALGLDASAVLDEIGRADGSTAGEGPSDWQSAGLDSLIDHIVSTHHVYMKTHLPRIEEMLAKVLKAHGERHGDSLRPLSAIFSAMKQELDAHLMKEEMILFPLIRNLDLARQEGRHFSNHCGSVRNPIRVMVMEHDSAGDALAQIEHLTGGYQPPEDACNTFRALYYELGEMERDLHRHIHLENNILFPRAVELESAQ